MPSQLQNERFAIFPQENGEIRVIISDDFKPQFLKLLSRGYNTWDDATPEMREFYDLICHGVVRQDYTHTGHWHRTDKESETPE